MSQPARAWCAQGILLAGCRLFALCRLSKSLEFESLQHRTFSRELSWPVVTIHACIAIQIRVAYKKLVCITTKIVQYIQHACIRLATSDWGDDETIRDSLASLALRSYSYCSTSSYTVSIQCDG